MCVCVCEPQINGGDDVCVSGDRLVTVPFLYIMCTWYSVVDGSCVNTHMRTVLGALRH